jgi:hypothetical protein
MFNFLVTATDDAWDQPGYYRLNARRDRPLPA